MESKVLFRLWTITDYEIEEQFLTEQHRAGWKFRRYVLPGFYFFDKCTPEEVVYRLDFDQAERGEKTEYLQLYRDYGWEYLFEVNGFSYFRKPVEPAEEDLEIFSDNYSRLEMVQRIFKRRMVPLLVVFLCCVMPQLLLQVSQSIREEYVAAKVLAGIFLVLFVVYVCLFIHCGIGIRRLKKKYEKM